MEDEIVEIIKEQGPINQGEIINEVLNVEYCSECGYKKKPESFRENKEEILKILRHLFDRHRIDYTIDWEIEWVGE